MVLILVYVTVSIATAFLIHAAIAANQWYREYRYQKALDDRLKEIRAKAKARYEESYCRLVSPLVRTPRE